MRSSVGIYIENESYSPLKHNHMSSFNSENIRVNTGQSRLDQIHTRPSSRHLSDHGSQDGTVHGRVDIENHSCLDRITTSLKHLDLL